MWIFSCKEYSNKQYSIQDKTIIFDSKFNIDFSNNKTILKVLGKCNMIYFNNYSSIETCIETNNNHIVKYNNKWLKSKFNKPIDKLPYTITKLILGHHF